MSPSVAAYNGKLYAFGGMFGDSRGYYDPIYDGDTFRMHNSAVCYDIASGKWSSISSLPDGDMCGGKTFIYKKKIYIVGGRASKEIPSPAQASPPGCRYNFKRVLPVWRRILAYDPLTDTYEYVSDIPRDTDSLIGYGIVVVGDMMYLIGGSHYCPCGKLGLIKCRCDIQKTVLGLHLPTRRWGTDFPELQYPRKACSPFYDGHTIQVVGGHDEKEYKSVTQYLAIDEFDSPTYRWASVDKAPLGATFQTVQLPAPYSLMCKAVEMNKRCR